MSDARLARDVVSLVCRLAVAAVFLYACLDKLAHPDAFAQNIANYRLVPMPLLHTFAWLLPVAELVVAIALVIGWQTRGASLLAAAMTTVFIVAIASALIRDLDISCGCFHTGDGSTVGRDLLLRDLVLLAGALVPIWLGAGRLSIDHWRRGTGAMQSTLQNS
jgi:uncharacterized membrane protein YphA (DoxX/SURF4 family)